MLLKVQLQNYQKICFVPIKKLQSNIFYHFAVGYPGYHHISDNNYGITRFFLLWYDMICHRVTELSRE